VGFASIQHPLQAYHDPLQLHVLSGVEHRLHEGVGGAEFDFLAVGVKAFDGGFIFDEGDDHIAFAGAAMGVDDDEVAAIDRRLAETLDPLFGYS